MISNTLLMFIVIFMTVVTVCSASYYFIRSKGALLSGLLRQEKYCLPKSKRRVKGQQKKGKIIKKACVYDYANDIHSMAFRKPSRIMRLFDAIVYGGKQKGKVVLPKYRDVPRMVGTGYERVYMEPICFTYIVFCCIKMVSCSKFTNFVNKVRSALCDSDESLCNRSKNKNIIPYHKADLEGRKSLLSVVLSKIKNVYLILTGRKYKDAYELELKKNLQLSREKDYILSMFMTSRDNLEGQVAQFKNVLVSKEKALKDLRTQKEETEKKIIEVETSNACLKDKLDTSIGEKKLLQQKLEDKTLVVKQQQEKNLSLGSKVDELTKETQENQVLIAHFKSKNGHLEDKINSLEQEATVLKYEKAELESENKYFLDALSLLNAIVDEGITDNKSQVEDEFDVEDELDANHVSETVHVLGTTQGLDTGVGLDTDAGLETIGVLVSNDLSDTNDLPDTNIELEANGGSDTDAVLGTNDLQVDKENKLVASLEVIDREDEVIKAEIYEDTNVSNQAQKNASASSSFYDMDDLSSVVSSKVLFDVVNTHVLDTGAGLDTDTGLDTTGVLVSNDLSDAHDLPDTNIELNIDGGSDNNSLVGTNDNSDDKEEKKFAASLETIHGDDEIVESVIDEEPNVTGQVQNTASTSSSFYEMDAHVSASSSYYEMDAHVSGSSSYYEMDAHVSASSSYYEMDAHVSASSSFYEMDAHVSASSSFYEMDAYVSGSSSYYGMDDVASMVDPKVSVDEVTKINSLQMVPDAGDNKVLQPSNTYNLNGKTLVSLVSSEESTKQIGTFEVVKVFLLSDNENKENYGSQFQDSLDGQDKLLNDNEKYLKELVIADDCKKIKPVQQSKNDKVQQIEKAYEAYCARIAFLLIRWVAKKGKCSLGTISCYHELEFGVKFQNMTMLRCVSVSTNFKILSAIQYQLADLSSKIGIDIYSPVVRSTFVLVIRGSQIVEQTSASTVLSKTSFKRNRFLVYCRRVKEDWKTAITTIASKVKLSSVKTRYGVIDEHASFSSSFYSSSYSKDSVKLCLPNIPDYSVKCSKNHSSSKKMKTLFRRYSSKRR